MSFYVRSFTTYILKEYYFTSSMDHHEIRSRLVSTLIAAISAAATTVTLLNMFQDTTSKGEKNSRSNDEEDSSNSELVSGIENCGSSDCLIPDFVAGVLRLASEAAKAPSGVGWFNNNGERTIVLSKPEHVKTLLSNVTTHALWGGIKPASEGKLPHN